MPLIRYFTSSELSLELLTVCAQCPHVAARGAFLTWMMVVANNVVSSYLKGNQQPPETIRIRLIISLVGGLYQLGCLGKLSKEVILPGAYVSEKGI